MTRRSVARAAVGMGGATALSRAWGFARVLVIAAALGTTYLGNTFQATNSVSNVLFELLAAGALSAVLVPTFVTLLHDGDDASADRLASGLLGVALKILIPVTIVAMAASPWIARLLSAGAPTERIADDQRHLATFLLLFFIPQVVLYAWGAVATGLLYARRQFAITAMAPIGNTIVMIACLVAFRIAAGNAPGFDLSLGEKLLLAVAGTGGVIAYVAVLVVAARRAGFSLRPRWRARDDEQLRRLTRHSGWGVLLHANAGLLLGAALVFGNRVAGGVVAYQVAFVFFLAPYAVLAQPIHTAILPELATKAGPELLGAALAFLSLGLLPYAALLLFARAFYALGDSRTPAIVAIASALLGVVTMAALAPLTRGTARVAALGAGHTLAYTVGAVVLGTMLFRRLDRPFAPRMLVVALCCATPLALGAWGAMRALHPQGRFPTIAVLMLLGAIGAAGYTWSVRRFRPALVRT
jgi:putative peptidoglycan lipid II flippase